MNSPSQGMSLFGKFKMLEQRVNQLTLNQPNTLDVSFFGSDKLKRLQERIENLSEYDSHMFSVLREENQHHAQDIASLKTICNELRTTTTRTQIDSRNDKLKKLEQKVDDLSQVQREKFSRYTDTLNELARETQAVKNEMQKVRYRFA